jgi:hypothetical protein
MPVRLSYDDLLELLDALISDLDDDQVLALTTDVANIITKYAGGVASNPRTIDDRSATAVDLRGDARSEDTGFYVRFFDEPDYRDLQS